MASYRPQHVIKTTHPILSARRILNEWSWDASCKSECISLSTNSKTAYFFDDPYSISRGTAGVRGTQPATSGIYYYEVKVTEPLYGTSVMFGYGTEETRLHYDNFDYVNLIGKDANSWGLSHKGTIWHNNKSQSYCEAFFDKETIVGVLLNTFEGTIEYFINGKCMGCAFRDLDLTRAKVYPMISSTATDIELELTDSFKLVYTLQYLSCSVICKHFSNYDQLPLAKRLICYLKEFSL